MTLVEHKNKMKHANISVTETCMDKLMLMLA